MDATMPDDVGLGYVQVLPVQWRKNLDLDVRAYPLPCLPATPPKAVIRATVLRSSFCS
jgi:hypothetical protein